MINITVLDTELDAIIDECNHDLAEQETACADGFCPICATAEIARLKAEIVRLKDGFDHLLRSHLEELDAAIDEAMKEEK